MLVETFLKITSLHSIFLFTIVIITAEETFQVKVPQPPSFVKQLPSGDLAVGFISSQYKKEKRISLDCEATGEPSVKYHWEKDGEPFRWEEHENITQYHGTLHVQEPSTLSGNYYQCFASNKYGTAVSNKVFIRTAEMEDVPQEPSLHRVINEGDPLTLKCNPPKGFPSPDIRWIQETKNGIYFQRNTINNRIIVDPEGDLHFSNFTRKDVATYVCQSSNGSPRVDRIMTGRVRVNVKETERPQRVPLVEQYVSSKDILALKGGSIHVYCIFGGSPLPDVRWEKFDGRTYRRATYSWYYDQRHLEFKNIDESHEGLYVCTVSNGVGKKETRTFKVTVEAKPYWETKPRDTFIEEGKDVQLKCNVSGLPDPEISWTVNGIPLDESKPNPRRRLISPTVLKIEKVLDSDTAVYQCNASNIHGHIHSNFFLKANITPPLILQKPKKLYETVQGASIELSCLVYGLPSVRWLHNGHEIKGNRYKVLVNGNLKIHDAKFTDAGKYQCIVSNNFGEIQSDSALGTLLIKEKTRLILSPQNIVAGKHWKASFACAAVADPSLDLAVEWGNYRNFPRPLRTKVFKSDPKKDVTYGRDTYEFTDVNYINDGRWYCVAKTRLDSVNATAVLIYKDPPGIPQYELECNGTKAVLTWWRDDSPYFKPPELSTIKIQYRTGFTPDVWEDFMTSLPVDAHKYELPMTPGAKYGFRPVFQNKYGEEYDRLTDGFCETPPDVPYKNPETISAISTTPENLMISWKPMPQIEHHAPGFFYRLCYREFRKEDEWIEQIDIHDWTQSQYEVKKIKPFSVYIIQVEAHNSKGQANVSAAEHIALSWNNELTEKPSFNWEHSFKKDGKVRIKLIDLPKLDESTGITSYVQHRKKGTTLWFKTYVNIKETYFYIDDLNPDTVYEVAVVNVNGLHQIQSDIEEIRTLDYSRLCG